MKSKTSEEVASIRKALQIDTWGSDLYRLKKRVGEQEMMIEALVDHMLSLEDRVVELEEVVKPALCRPDE